MSLKIIQERLATYRTKNQLDEENSLKEITQEIALSGLARAGFFKQAAFQGGTCLRILYGLNRFSEDLDFCLLKPNSKFSWQPYLVSLQSELEAYGYLLQIQDRSSPTAHVKAAFLKDDSLGKLLQLQHRSLNPTKSLRIKLEIDTNPPAGGLTELKNISFPVTVAVLSQDLPSLFAGKSHALLCRTWDKGRDWFDFIWYVGRNICPNFSLLGNAVQQTGPWQGQNIEVNKRWYFSAMEEKIRQVDWKKNKIDIVRFLKESDRDLLHLWDQAFFLERLAHLSSGI